MEIIKIYEGNLVNARELQQFLEVKSDFSHWIKRMIKYGLEKDKDYFTLVKKDERQKLIEYLLTIPAAKEICMLQRNAKGAQARKYFIACEERLALLAHDKRFAAFNELEATKERFRETLKSIGLIDKDYVEIDTAGKKVLMNGDPIADELLQTVLMKARDLATQMTHFHTVNNSLKEADKIKESNEENHAGVRDTLLDKGIVPENLPQEEDIKKLQQGEEGGQEA